MVYTEPLWASRQSSQSSWAVCNLLEEANEQASQGIRAAAVCSYPSTAWPEGEEP